MTGIALAAVSAFALAALAGSVRLMRQRRRLPQQRERIILARAGGRAFASHLGSLSGVGNGLEIPTESGAWRRLVSITSVR
jgi:hypothetical protein